jgi:reactive intermediate/imine deaminase
MARQIVTTKNAPQAIGTYSQAIRAGDTVYMSGQIALDPVSGEMVGGDMEAQIRRVFDNLQAIAAAAGASLAAAVKLTVYVIDLKHFPTVNQVMAQYFREPFPARATIQVSALPKGAQVEIDCVLDLSK